MDAAHPSTLPDASVPKLQIGENYKVGTDGRWWRVLFRVPSGLIVTKTELPNYPYAHGARDAIVNVWRPSRWESWMFNFSSTDNGTFVFDKG